MDIDAAASPKGLRRARAQRAEEAVGQLATGDGSAVSVESEIVGADVQDQSTLDKYLQVWGGSPNGQFGEDAAHKPTESTWMMKKEVVPGWVVGSSDRNSEIIFESTLYRSGPTAVYTIAGHPELVIKYYAYCKDRYEPNDAVVVEAYFMKRLESLDIAPKVHFYSGFIDSVPGAYLTDPKRTKTPTSTCAANAPKPHIRYMIMERLGMSWKDYMHRMPEKKIGFVESIKIGAKVIMLIRKLHGENIVHGDAHMGNFVFKKPGEFKQLAIIDFGRARIISARDQADAERERSPEKFCEGKKVNHPWHGKWEMNGCKPSFHDDIYRVVQNTAMSIHGMRHFHYLDDLMKADVTEYKRMKNSADFWEFPGMTLDGIVAADKIATIRGILRNISRLASYMPRKDPHAKPSYRTILRQYRRIIHEMTGAKMDDRKIFDL